MTAITINDISQNLLYNNKIRVVIGFKVFNGRHWSTSFTQWYIILLGGIAGICFE